MPLHYIQIVDSDPAAALVTQLGLQSLLKTDAEIVIGVPAAQPGQYAPDSHTSIDLLIVDPGSQSQAATRLIKSLQKTCPDTPLLVLTAYDSPLLRSQMRALGVRHYIAKPVDLPELERVVRDVLASLQEA
jgi:DNA-binding NarL/FixJ family response regulator